MFFSVVDLHLFRIPNLLSLCIASKAALHASGIVYGEGDLFKLQM